MTGPTFAELSVPPLPWAWDGAYAQRGWTWFDSVCPPQVAHQCVKPGQPILEVPEPSTALMLALGLVAMYVWRRRA